MNEELITILSKLPSSKHGLELDDSKFKRVREELRSNGFNLQYDRSSKTWNVDKGESVSSSGLERVVSDVFAKEGISVDEASRLIKLVKKPNHSENSYSKTKLDIPDKHIKYGVISDTHMGSKDYRPDILEHAVNKFTREGVDFVLHTGDILEGMSGRDGHIYELTHLGATAQVNYAVEQLSQIKQKVYGITATNSHDGWFSSKGNTGFEVGPELDAKIDNFNFIGYDEVDVETDGGAKIRLLHPGGGTCFDDETEILTENGWVLFKNLKIGEKVATLNEEKNLFEWQEPFNYIDEEYNGELLHFNARTFDLLVTPNHRMLVRRYNTAINYGRKEELTHPTKSHKKISKEWTVKTADQLKECKRQEWQMKRGGQSWNGSVLESVNIPCRLPKKFASTTIKHLGDLHIEDAAELIAWYVTEGHVCKKQKQLNICQSLRVNPDNHYQIIDLFNRIGFEVKGRGVDNKDITVSSVELCEWLVKECSRGSKNKFLPKWLKEQPTEILEIVFDTMIKGDGWVNGRGFGYRSISKRLLEDISEIGVKLGYGVTFYGEDCINFSKVQIYPTINNKPKLVNYVGKVYCVSVPNETILVRRNGKVIWSKNSYAISYKMQKYINSLSGGDKPQIIHEGHYHKLNYLFYRNIHAFDAGALQAQTNFMKKQGTPSMLAYTIVDLYLDKDGSVNSIKPEFVTFYDNKVDKIKV